MAINIPGFAFHRALKARKGLLAVFQSIVDGRREEKKKQVADLNYGVRAMAINIPGFAFPHYHVPEEPLSPLYPTFPNRYDPVLTGKCPAPVNFTVISDIFDRTSDCTQPFDLVVGNVIWCSQLSSLLHIFQGYYIRSANKLVLQDSANKLVLQDSVADDCFLDIISIRALISLKHLKRGMGNSSV